ncbi:hypothetical protein [Pseudoalteromonas luteoviolacea]|uniref:Uncharacterized protein n=1 Tax=Pseudoalteromonas luteoviolacea S4054 TaxID=1129367 RepID=A0A0F6A9G0_9GAMM|nr:hypothetical protein [Pseudoalteromonas luteoviolacea]AOT08679.1 hypothetical protein S4054249_12810 [Pseudoalteromonas luteoviolacea]AOT13594.1 hypothetical protein S40542_12785 [Pseudoalteromonas luteoviolacea]AOT18507.1 hypothetical protein S4054_12785 [Pseudoalteromonas luteoviolacea]KKE82486.1 hypothetical protein N479_17930 [Pseudoalteromonas luteoviolacea S4054]KZN72023.1 hypothetical protein N481_16565 [Pseudoalteromonas luteoviolacea S4047-1]
MIIKISAFLYILLQASLVMAADYTVRGVVASMTLPSHHTCTKKHTLIANEYTTNQATSDFLIISGIHGNHEFFLKMVENSYETSSFKYAKSIGANFVVSQPVTIKANDEVPDEYKHLLFSFGSSDSIILLPPIFFVCDKDGTKSPQ